MSACVIFNQLIRTFLSQPNQHEALSMAAFDQAAAAYDAAFSYSPVGKLQRERVHHFFRQEINGKALQVLEINCGTGEDALWFAAGGHHVIATDVSAMMIALADEKTKGHSYKGTVQTRQLAFRDLKDAFAPHSFDLVFSDFGGLNCIPPAAISTLLQDADLLLKPGGRFIAVIMGRKCVWERCYFLLKGKKQEAYRRNNTAPLDVPLGKQQMPAWYYAPSAIRRMAASLFTCTAVKPVGIVLPPSYLQPFFTKRKSWLSALNRLEPLLSFSAFSNYADHFYISLRKKN
ncbi:MAG: class I SAM-dependent methyltransferase [Chitinophagales bacterium]|nr:class I SAM-dependent methyltransferase [Chitinophagales bacterium]